MLSTRRAGTGPTVVLLHGFTQNAQCWGPLFDDLASDHRVVAVDLPGHGDSAHDAADLEEAADLVVEAAGAGLYVGYSLGGRVALHAALGSAAVQAMVLIGATAGLDDPEARAARRAADEQLATQLEHEGLERFVDTWLSLPLFSGLTDDTAHRAQRMQNRVEGLAASLRNCGTGTQEPLWSRLASLSCAVEVVYGADDAKFAEIGQRLAAATNTGATHAVSSAGHSAHLERPEAVASIIRSAGGRLRQ